MGYTTYQPVLRVHLQKCDVMIFCLALPWYTLWWCGFFSIFGLAWTNFTMGFHAFLYPVFLAMTVSFFTPWFSNDMKLEHDLFQEKEHLYTKAPFLAFITFSFGKRCIWNIWISTLNLSFHWWVHGGTVPLVFCGSPVPGGGGWNLWWKTLCPLQMEGGPQKN